MNRVGRAFMDQTEHARVGQSLVSSALRVNAVDAARRVATRSLTDVRVPGSIPSVHWPERRPQLVCTPRSGAGACNVFDLTTATVVGVPRGTVVPAWPGAPGFFAGGPTVRVRLSNGHFAFAYTRDFPRVVLDRVGQVSLSLVDAALRLDAARRADLAERVRLQQGLPTTPNPLSRAPFDPARSLPGRMHDVQFPDRSRPRLPSRAELLRRFGIVEGPAVVLRDRGVQIWSHPSGEVRPGTNIPLMTRQWVLPKGTPVTLTPNDALIAALENAALFDNAGRGIGTAGSYWVRWDLSRNPLAMLFQVAGIPIQGQGWARPYAPDGGAWFRSAPVPT